MGQDLERLQGTWNIVSLEMDGQKMSGGGARIVVRGDRFTTIAMGATYEGTVTVHAGTAPRGFRSALRGRSGEGKYLFGIYELDGRHVEDLPDNARQPASDGVRRAARYGDCAGDLAAADGGMCGCRGRGAGATGCGIGRFHVPNWPGNGFRFPW